MPIYEYKCENCGEVFEVRQNYSDEPVTVHEKCGGRGEKMISPPSFNFKGSGWDVDNYPKGGGNGAKKGGSESKSTTDWGKSASESTTKSDSATKSSETKTSDSSSSTTSTSTTKPSKSE